MLQRHFGEELKVFRGFLHYLFGRVEAVHQQRPPACPFMSEAVEHLDAVESDKGDLVSDLDPGQIPGLETVSPHCSCILFRDLD